MPQANNYDVIVIGTGSIGYSTVDYLADDYNVLVLEKGELEESASASVGAFISDWWFFLEGEYIPSVVAEVHDYLEELSAAGDSEFHAQPFISLADENEVGSPETRKIHKNVKKIPGIEYFDADEFAELYPDILNLEGFIDGIVDTEAGYVRLCPYLRVMGEHAERKGVEFKFGTEVTGIETGIGSVIGVTMTPGDLVQRDSVVVAIGTHAESLVTEFTDPPVQPFVVCVTAVRGDPAFSGSVPTTSSRGTLVGLNADGDLLVGDEYRIEGLDSAPWDSPKEAQERVAELLPQLFIGFGGGLEYIDGDEHHYPEGITITSDQIPVIDEVGDVDGLVVADDSRGVVSLAPVIAVAV